MHSWHAQLRSADIVVPRMAAWRLLWDFRTIKDLARELPDDSPLGNKCMEVANRILNVYRGPDLATIEPAREIAQEILGKDWEKSGDKVYDEPKPNDTLSWGIGNCHIDTAWLWPYSATMQKTARSWSTQVDLMNRYPEHRFVASQAQQFKWLEQQHPLLFSEIKQKIQEGKFLPIGGSWVESDTNMPSGEALCRQFLYGQRYFKSRFGSYCRTYWLPDSFGYSSQLPQLARLAGCDFFFTQKLSWSQFNNFPHSTFMWAGQDGTQVLTHMCPINTYTAQASVGDVLNSVRRNKSLQSGVADGLLTFGNGDGGGGPLAPMLENMRRCRAVANTHGQIPKATMGTNVEEFYENVLDKSKGGKTLPTWDGELYLELHRGTATSHGSIKRGNRKSELLMRDIEFIGTLASVVNHKEYTFPKDDVDELWETLLLQQFHDVLPGSAIELVYEDAEKAFAKIAKGGRKLLTHAIEALHPDLVPLDAANDVDGTLVALNTELIPRVDVLEVPVSHAKSLMNDTLVQISADGSSAFVLLEDRAASGVAAPAPFDGVTIDSLVPATAYKSGSDHVLANGQLKVTITEQGRVASIYDVEHSRELIKPGSTGGFVIFQDLPLNWDAWDVDAFHLETKEEVNACEVELAQEGPLRASLRIKYPLSKASYVEAVVSLDAVSAQPMPDSLAALRFDTFVEWHEQHRFLKFEVPLTIRSEFATYENQFGCCSRPTVRNTTWDRAKFEVVGHKFADLSEYGYGVAILNDCKYGYACEGSTLRLSLLRGPTVPDAHCDQGQHHFSFAVFPHRSDFRTSHVVAAGRIFNSPMHLRKAPKKLAVAEIAAKGRPFSLVGSPNIVLDNIKRGEDDHFKSKSPTIIVRLYESMGGHGAATLETSLPVVSASICNILENDTKFVNVLRASSADGNPKFMVPVALHGFEVLTLKLRLKL